MSELLPPDAGASVETRLVPLIAVREQARPDELATALIAIAREKLPLAYDALDSWWARAPGEARHALVFRLVQGLERVDSITAQALLDPRWRASVGVPLALATFVTSLRGRRRHRAANSLAAQRSDWRTWRRWCKVHRYPTFNPSKRQLQHFLDHFAPRHKVATIRRWGASFAAMHEAAGFPNPLKSPLNRNTWLGACKPPDTSKKGVRPDRRNLPVDQAQGLTRDQLERVLAACKTDTLIGARDAALLATAYDLMGRRAEVVALNVEDIQVFDNGTGVARIRKSKTDQEAEGTALFLRPDTCERLVHWLSAAELDHDALFRSLRGFAGTGAARPRARLPAAELSKIIRRRIRSAGIFDAAELGTTEVERRIAAFSGHSLRVGPAQDMTAAGISDVDLMNAGRWTSLTMVVRYTRAQRAQHGGMAKLAALQDGSIGQTAE